MERNCGSCKYGHYDDEEGYMCANSDSEYVADYVEFEHWCEDFEEKE